MDVQARKLIWWIGLGAVLLLGLLLRLKGIHTPLLDHPGWRQGDDASIARNFATLRYNIFFPQTNYNGPPPNYVELELQIVPFLTATLYKIFGTHEIFGRLITLAFSLGTVAVLAYFGRWLFASTCAGLVAAAAYAIMPGSLYYGRTLTPDATMVFFMTAAFYAIARMVIDEERWRLRGIVWCTVLLAMALLAKPVAAIILLPIVVLMGERARSGRTFHWGAAAAIVLVPILTYLGYDRIVSAHAEWHWTSGKLRLHELPQLRASLQSATGFSRKLAQFRVMLGVLAQTMIGPAVAAVALLGLCFPPQSTKSRSLLWTWLAAGLVYIYVVVTVERVDYYMLPLLPLAALLFGGLASRPWNALQNVVEDSGARIAVAAIGILALCGITYQNRQIVAPYYRYSAQVYRNAISLNRTLAPNALVVMGHYDPSVLYYIGRYGWEEDPYLWTPFDEQSAIRKGARYFIAIEKNRFYRNVELCAWMQRFPVINPNAQWPVYETDPAKTKPGAEKQWRSFRNAEKAGHARAWLDRNSVCSSS